MYELHDFFLSTSAYRVRIGLHLKGVGHGTVPVSLIKGGGEQHLAEFRALNPQGMVPVFCHDSIVLTQSMAILEFLDERYPEPPLLPEKADERARVRQLAQIIACDIQPLNNLRVLAYLRTVLKADEDARSMWFRHWLLEGLDTLELWLTAIRSTGPYCLGAQVTLADVCLVPLLYSARRFKLSLDDFPTLCDVEEACLALEAFSETHPDKQPESKK
jgi:maleylacetoacetate isomerase